MHEIPLLGELLALVGLAVLAALLLAKLRLPLVAGLLLTGALAGPYAFRLISDPEALQTLTEIGVVLLLFSIGLEYSAQRLVNARRLVVVGGLIQVGATVALVAAGALLLGMTPINALFLGFVFSLSSTALVLKLLQDRGEMHAPHGQIITGMLIFQDLAFIPMLLALPLMAQGKAGPELAAQIGWLVVKSALLGLGTYFLGRYGLPWVFKLIDATRNRQLFLLAVLLVCLGGAFGSAQAGLSFALGAFLAGVALANSDYAHRAMSEILPLRDVLTSLFFIALGMLLDWRVLLDKPLVVISWLVILVAIKAAVATTAALIMKFPPRVAWLTGVGLAQFGEFGFVLITSALALGLVDAETARVLLAAGVLSMFLTPLAVHLAPHATAGEMLLQPLAEQIGAPGIDATGIAATNLADHIVVIGYGPAGRMLINELSHYGLPFVVLDLNAAKVARERAQGLPVYYGDATSREALAHAGARKARAVVLLIDDRQAVRRVVATLRHCAPGVPILVRARYLSDVEGLKALGVSEVAADEIEAGRHIVTLTLNKLGIERRMRGTGHPAAVD